jgi:hypothetical protein
MAPTILLVISLSSGVADGARVGSTIGWSLGTEPLADWLEQQLLGLFVVSTSAWALVGEILAGSMEPSSRVCLSGV